jgi:ABC-2 type transport system ATP-binding protein
MIEVRDLRIDYDDVCAVRDVSMEIPDGEVYGLIGPNGAGKTSTLRSLMGLQEPTYGEILIDGIDLFERHEEASRILGFMPDFSPIYEDLMVWEYLDLFAASYGIPKAERPSTIDRYLALVDLTEKREAMTAGLSRGMKQRLILAKTLLPEPRVVLLDEPASGMDPHGRALLRNILRDLGAQGRTVLISSHILTELSEMCTSVGIMERGRMVLSGRVEDIASTVLGQTQLCVEVLSPEEAFRETLAADTRVGPVTAAGKTYTFSFAGDEEQASDLLASLVRAGIRISSFTRKKEDLEEVFLKVGAKEVS